MIRIALTFILTLTTVFLFAQPQWEQVIERELPSILKEHRVFVSIPNVPIVKEDIYKNVEYVTKAFQARDFNVRLLKSESLPVFFAEREVDPDLKTVLFYFHLDGQPAAAENWDQEDPFIPVLKEINNEGQWTNLDWSKLDGEINPEWRIFGRAAADDKGPITMMLSAIQLLDRADQKLAYNVKIILDLQEESGSDGFLSTLDQYKDDYAADYMIIMDGPAHNSNRPTLTFGCRGIVSCSITTYGAKLPQHSGHYGNYAPNPVFRLSHLLASMKDESGFVTIDDYYEGIEISEEIKQALSKVPDKEVEILQAIGIKTADAVGKGYQEAMQYPSLNVRHVETAWKGPGLKTIIPEYVTAHIDVRLVVETDALEQINKIKKHVEKQGYLVLDRDPTDEERASYDKIVKFTHNNGMNAFRTDMNAPFGKMLINTMEMAFGQAPVSIRTMGGTVPIIPAINTLGIPAIIVPMVNMDNNQHNPNENLRIGNMSQGIRMCIEILTMQVN